jgi:hypothetical protein
VVTVLADWTSVGEKSEWPHRGDRILSYAAHDPSQIGAFISIFVIGCVCLVILGGARREKRQLSTW